MQVEKYRQAAQSVVLDDPMCQNAQTFLDFHFFTRFNLEFLFSNFLLAIPHRLRRFLELPYSFGDFLALSWDAESEAFRGVHGRARGDL